VTPGVQVNFVSQPYKIGQAFGVTYLEAHHPLKEEKGRKEGALGEIARLLAQRGVTTAEVDWATVRQEIAKPTGMPVPISQQEDVLLLDANAEPYPSLADRR